MHKYANDVASVSNVNVSFIEFNDNKHVRDLDAYKDPDDPNKKKDRNGSGTGSNNLPESDSWGARPSWKLLRPVRAADG
jgi:hypothetical protein